MQVVQQQSKSPENKHKRHGHQPGAKVSSSSNHGNSKGLVVARTVTAKYTTITNSQPIQTDMKLLLSARSSAATIMPPQGLC